jgi:hypothetical protein
VTSQLRRNLPSTALAAGLTRADAVLDAGLRAAAADDQVFDDLVELGLAAGTLTPRLVGGLVGGLAGRAAGGLAGRAAGGLGGIARPSRGTRSP